MVTKMMSPEQRKKYPTMEIYATDRAACLEAVMEHYRVDRSAAKQAFLVLANKGSVGLWREETGVSHLIDDLPLLEDISTECRFFANELWKAAPEDHRRTVESWKSNRPECTYLFYRWAHWERRAIDGMRVAAGNAVCGYAYDGLECVAGTPIEIFGAATTLKIVQKPHPTTFKAALEGLALKWPMLEWGPVSRYSTEKLLDALQSIKEERELVRHMNPRTPEVLLPAPKNHRSYALLVASILEQDLLISTKKNADKAVVIKMWSQSRHCWNHVGSRFVENAVFDVIGVITGSIGYSVCTGWWARKMRGWAETGSFGSAAAEQTINMLLTDEEYEFDSEACRPLFAFSDGMCYDARTGKVEVARRSDMNTKHCPWPYKDTPVEGFEDVSKDLLKFYSRPEIRSGKCTGLRDDLVGHSIISKLEKIKKKSEVLRIVHTSYNDWDKVIWFLRLCSSAMAGSMLQMLTYFYGVGGAGKDVVIGLCTVLMGKGPRNYSRVLKKSYFLKESSPESPSPFLAALVAARWVVCTEIPDKAIIAENLKDITDPRGAQLTARDLYQSPVNFHPFFRLVIMSNHELMLDKKDTGVERRFTALVHKKAFKDDPKEKHHLQADPKVKTRIHRGDFVYEMFYLLRCLVPTLAEEVTGDMRILPLPKDQSAAEGEFEDEGKCADMTLDTLLKDHLVEVTSMLATKGTKVREALKEKLGLKNEAAVLELLKAKGVIKQKIQLQDGGYHHCYYFERKGLPVYLALKP